MTTTLRHALILLLAIFMVSACEHNYVESDSLGTDQITQNKLIYDTVPGMRDPFPPDTLVDEDAADTISVAEAISIGLSIPRGKTTTDSYYVLGYVMGFYQEFDASYGNISPIICYKTTNRKMTCYRLKSFNNKAFTSAEQLQVGDIVVVYGKIENRNAEPQITSGGYLVTSNNPASGYVPAPRTIFKEQFKSGFGKFTVKNQEGTTDDVWTAAEAGGQVVASGNIGGAAKETESWLISPTIDFTTCPRGVELRFSHCCRGKAAQAAIRPELARVLVSTDNGATWEQVTMDDSKWNKIAQARFVTAKLDLTEYATSTTCKIAFAYKSTADVALTWSIQNVRIGEPDLPEEE